MAGTPDVTSDLETKTELDFRNRLIAAAIATDMTLEEGLRRAG